MIYTQCAAKGPWMRYTKFTAKGPWMMYRVGKVKHTQSDFLCFLVSQCLWRRGDGEKAEW